MDNLTNQFLKENTSQSLAENKIEKIIEKSIYTAWFDVPNYKLMVKSHPYLFPEDIIRKINKKIVNDDYELEFSFHKGIFYIDLKTNQIFTSKKISYETLVDIITQDIIYSDVEDLDREILVQLPLSDLKIANFQDQHYHEIMENYNFWYDWLKYNFSEEAVSNKYFLEELSSQRYFHQFVNLIHKYLEMGIWSHNIMRNAKF